MKKLIKQSNKNAEVLMANKDKSLSWQLFDTIASHYDRLNRLLSLGFDMKWRREVAKHVAWKKSMRYLDLATGTCDLMIALVKISLVKISLVKISLVEKNKQYIKEAIGVDLSKDMLSIGNAKLKKNHIDHIATTKIADANKLPFKANSFDLITSSFGIRNMQNPLTTLKESMRVLKDGGQFIILEFSQPSHKKLYGKTYLWFFKNVMPIIGKMFSGNLAAYSYLNKTVLQFPYGKDFIALLEKAQFQNCYYKNMLGGILAVYVGEKKDKSKKK